MYKKEMVYENAYNRTTGLLQGCILELESLQLQLEEVKTLLRIKSIDDEMKVKAIKQILEV